MSGRWGNGAPLGPNLTRRREGGTGDVDEALRCVVGGDFVGLLVDGVGCAKV